LPNIYIIKKSFYSKFSKSFKVIFSLTLSNSKNYRVILNIIDFKYEISKLKSQISKKNIKSQISNIKYEVSNLKH